MRTILLLLFLGSALGLQSQHQINDSQVALDAMELRFPGYKEAVNATFESQVQRFVEKSSSSNDLLTIPVVIHIVWKEVEENLSDVLVEEQMQSLNEVFTRTNADTINLRTEFLPIAGNPNIAFELMDVIRTQTTEDFVVDIFGGTLVDGVKSSANGGSDPWNTENFLNIWVLNVQGDGFFIPDDALLGYAYPPADLVNWPAGSNAPSPGLEGVVMHYKAFGINNPYPIIDPSTMLPVDLSGKAAAHEVGHYLGLRHISGDPGYGADGCLVDDGMDDTPQQGILSAFDCDVTQNSCVEGLIDLPDMIENYMDYSAHGCQNSFSHDQSEFVRFVLEDSRPGLLSGASAIDESFVSTVQLSPNPSDGLVSYTLGDASQELLGIEIFDILGNKMENVGLGQKVIDLTEVTSGLYLVRFQFEKGSSTERLIVK